MALREIIKFGDDMLRKKCREVTKFDDKLATLLDDMAETLRTEWDLPRRKSGYSGACALWTCATSTGLWS